MRQLAAVTAALVVTAACSASPTATPGEFEELLPSYSGVFGGSGNRDDGFTMGSGNRQTETATATENAAAESSPSRGGVLGGSGNRNDGSGTGTLRAKSVTTSTAATDSTTARGGLLGGSGN